MRIYDTLSRTKVEIEPSKEFKMFVCGPTVQDNVHLGHAKTYLAFDVLARWLLKQGNNVFFLLNITDVDDKIFNRSKEENVPYSQIADKFFREFVEDIDALNIQTISKFERVSSHVEASSELVKQLLAAGKAYSLNHNVYFDTTKAVDFGKLSHQSPMDLKLKQVDAAPGKKNGVDFLLWRNISGEGEPVWQTSFGVGRPGWHIEDSAIAFAQMRGPYDLHGGATELIFPHHESELAQDEAISGQIPFVKIWMHTGLLLKDDEKMSKSLGNVVTIREALRNYSPDEVRYYFLKHHYRESFEYDAKSMGKSKEEFKKLVEASKVAAKLKNTIDSLGSVWSDFAAAMNDDLQTPEALAVLMEAGERIRGGKREQELTSVFWSMVETLGFRMF